VVQDEWIPMMWPYTEEENDFISLGRLPEQAQDETEQVSEPAEAA
jgi:hypothetical protein